MFGELLREVQRIKSEGDFAAGQALIENYGTKVDPELHAEVLRRYESLDRIQSASNELDTRLQEVQAQDERVLQLQTRLGTLVDELIQQANADAMSAAPVVDPAAAGEALMKNISLDLKLASASFKIAPAAQGQDSTPASTEGA